MPMHELKHKTETLPLFIYFFTKAMKQIFDETSTALKNILEYQKDYVK